MAIVVQQPPQTPVVEVEKLKDNLYVLKGGGGNTAVFVTAAGVVVVDAKNPGWGQPILDKIKTLTDKSVTTLTKTHTHGDHVSGNVEFPTTVDIIVQENTKTNMMKMMPQQLGGGSEAAREDHLRPERRPRPHERRRLGRLPGAACRARRRYIFGQEHPAARREQRRERGRKSRTASRRSTTGSRMSTPSSPATARR